MVLQMKATESTAAVAPESIMTDGVEAMADLDAHDDNPTRIPDRLSAWRRQGSP